ncbi:MAG: cell division protein FtsZ [Bacteroidales bacterium]|nr:cell division protein FtsZ [Bacteroidales bacterium]MBQ9639865.1 cell division protein FtsZ [Bacteroidales bacterium]
MEDILNFDSPKQQSSYIKVIGVGGGGGNAVNNMYDQGITGVDFIVCNTDMKALNNSPVPNKIILGELGAGNIPEVARKAALEHRDDIREAISRNTQMLFITAGMGGGTGTGAAPVIAEVAKSIELDDETVGSILVVAVVTVPFSFEGRRRRQQAEEGIALLRQHVDSILIINNDKLRQLGNLTLSQAFKKADDVLFTAVKSIAEIITVKAYVNIDFHDVNTVMANSGTALMGAGVGRGENRASDAIVEASTSVLLNDNDICGAKNVLLYFSYSPEKELTMDEMAIITEYVTDLTGVDVADVIWGSGADASLTDELKVTLIATGFESQKNMPGNADKTKTVFTLKPEQSEEHTAAPAGQTPAAPKKDTPADNTSKSNTEQPQDVKKVLNLYTSEELEQLCTTTQNSPEPVEQPQVRDVYDDGINLVRREAETPTLHTPSTPSEQPQASVAEPHIAVVQNPMPEAEVATQTYEAAVVVEAEVKPTEEPARQEVEQPQMMQSSPRPAFTPAAQPMQHLQQSNNDRMAMDRAMRIQRMNELLHNNPDGPQIVANMTTEQLTNEAVFQAPHSSESDVQRVSMNDKGQMRALNSYLFNRAD